ncbi:tRNase Z TRZ2, chloroplastic [Vitis vinifera]|uniref:TRNase Z TRZ2, chloroplastic n=1 Tax=Vitis vinifera TaxID=29760 RepID=A0A438JHH0_VITVI|nr:tRNase Z TRZ2, chloroplastic [Vitis vinifera]
MQISLPFSTSKVPYLSPLPNPTPQPPLTIPKPHPKSYITAHSSRPKGSGYLSLIGRAIEEEEEYRKARAEVARNGVDLEGYSIEGISIGGHETCVIIPELKSAFDIGRCPSRAIQQNFLFITHAHLDHIGGLPMYVATRGLYNLKPPTIFVPPCIKEDVEKLFDIHRALSQVELKLDLVALDVGMETYEMRNNLVVRPFKTHHVIPSQFTKCLQPEILHILSCDTWFLQGYVIYSVRKKLKKQYIHLKGKQIEKLKNSGIEITDTILSPEVAFTGDTRSDFMLEPRNADALRAKVLITEATFLDNGISIDHAREHGHTHLFEIIENAEWIRNKAVLLTHFSSRYHIEVSIEHLTQSTSSTNVILKHVFVSS